MVRGWVLYPEHKVANAYDWMIASAKKHNITLEVLFADRMCYKIEPSAIKIFYDGEEVALPHFVLMRHYDFELSQMFEIMGVRVFNTTHSMRLSQDKLQTHLTLMAGGVCSPDTIYGNSDYSFLSSRLGTPFIVKAIRGSKGEEVFLIDDIEQINEVLSCVGSDFIAQKYISTSYGRDIRVWVVGGEVVAYVLRQNSQSFKSNIALGGDAIHIELPNRAKELALESCRLIGLEMGGVDILFGKGDNDFVVCEVNGNAGFRAFGMAGEKVDIPNAIFKYIISQLT